MCIRRPGNVHVLTTLIHLFGLFSIKLGKEKISNIEKNWSLNKKLIPTQIS